MQKKETPNSTKQSKSSQVKRQRQHFRKELSAGGIIYRKRGSLVEFFFIQDPFGKWTFPKGHQEAGETLAQTAVREIEEETGLSGLHYVSPLGRTMFKFKRGKTLIEKTVYLFLFEVPPETVEKLPGIEGIEKADWFSPSRARQISGYRNLDKILNRALRLAAKHKHRSLEEKPQIKRSREQNDLSSRLKRSPESFRGEA